MNSRIVIDPQIQHGKPVIRGTRVPVARVVGGLAGGMSKEEVMREYEISDQDVLAALEYAVELIEVKSAIIQPTAYPHIVKVDGICGGAAIIEGTRIAVWHLIGYYYKVGMSIEDILTEWDHLTPSQVFSALAYYHDNQEEIDLIREQNSYEYWKEH